METRARILVVDDDPQIVTLVTQGLEQIGYEARGASDGPRALEIAVDWQPDVVILDVRLPTMNGFEICRRLRPQRELGCRVLFLTVMDLLQDREIGFEVGGDDYLSKPFVMEELLWRVRALLRRGESRGTERLQVGPLLLNCRAGKVWIGDRREQLTPRECDLLSFLMKHPSQPFTYHELLQQIWGYSPGVGTPALVRVYICSLRRKIEPDPSHPIYLVNVSHHGYMCCEGPS